MKIGIAFDLKDSIIPELNSPEDMLEEYDSPETIDRIAEILINEGHEVFK